MNFISLDWNNKLKDNGLSTFINTTYNDIYRSNYLTAALDYLPEMVDLKVEGLSNQTGDLYQNMTGSFKTDIHLTPKVVQLDHNHKYDNIQNDYEYYDYYDSKYGWVKNYREFKRNETSGSILKFRNIINRYDDFESLIDASYMNGYRNYTLKSNLSHLNDETRLTSKVTKRSIGDIAYYGDSHSYTSFNFSDKTNRNNFTALDIHNFGLRIEFGQIEMAKDFKEEKFTNRFDVNYKSSNSQKHRNNLHYRSFEATLIHPDDNEFGFNITQQESNSSVTLVVPDRTLRLTYSPDPKHHLLFQWDLINDPSKSATISLDKNDNEMSLLIEKTPNFNLIKLSAGRERRFNETLFTSSVFYELKKNKKTNKLEMTAVFGSNIDTNSFDFNVNLVRPSFDVKFKNKFDKYTGVPDLIDLRIGKVLRFNVEDQPIGNKRVLFEIVNFDKNVYNFEGTSMYSNNMYTVQSVLKKNANQISRMISEYDTISNELNVKLDGEKNNYKLNFGLFNEFLANGALINENLNKTLAYGSIQLKKLNKYSYENTLAIDIKWNNFWNSIKQDILGRDIQNLRAKSLFLSGIKELEAEFSPIIEYNQKELNKLISDLNIWKSNQRIGHLKQTSIQYEHDIAYFDNDMTYDEWEVDDTYIGGVGDNEVEYEIDNEEFLDDIEFIDGSDDEEFNEYVFKHQPQSDYEDNGENSYFKGQTEENDYDMAVSNEGGDRIAYLRLVRYSYKHDRDGNLKNHISIWFGKTHAYNLYHLNTLYQRKRIEVASFLNQLKLNAIKR